MGKSTEGLAIWAHPRTGDGNPSFEAHFNYWRLAGFRKFSFRSRPYWPWIRQNDFLEIGLMLSRPKHIASVHVFIPFRCERPMVADLGPKFDNPDLAQAIFNEAFEGMALGPRHRWVDLRKPDAHFCRVHCFATSNKLLDEKQLAFRELDGGCVVSLTQMAIDASTENLGENERLYFRIRLDLGNKRVTPFVDVMSPGDRHLQSGFDEVEVVNFRVNEARTLPDSIEKVIREEKTEHGEVPMSRLVFPTAVPIVSGLSISHPSAYKSRLLESDIWQSYVDLETPRRMMVYHWRQDPPKVKGTDGTEHQDPAGVADFTALVKLQTRRSGPVIVTIYVLIAFLLGYLGNLLASATERATGLDQSHASEPAVQPSTADPVAPAGAEVTPPALETPAAPQNAETDQ